MGKHCFVVLFTIAFVVSLAQAGRVNLRKELEESIWRSNSSRRALSACAANNIIDKCWRCKPNWEQNRQSLPGCAQGFAKGTTGGKGGAIYKVTVPTDDPVNPKEGMLRFGVIQKRPLWIIFDKDMVINLKLEMVVASDKTIDGRGAKVQITGTGLTIYNVKNVIIHGIHIHDVKESPGGLVKSSEGPPIMRSKTDGDAIFVAHSSKIWIDHCTLSRGVDGLIDVTFGSTAVTISNCKFTNHEKLILFGANNEHHQDKNMVATVAFNWFAEGCDQRMPRCRFGFFQVVNNNYDGWGEYAIGGSAAPTILSQGNRFKAPNKRFKKNVFARFDAPEPEFMKWNWRTEKDVLENGAAIIPSGSDPQMSPEQRAGLIAAEPGTSAPQLTSAAGALSCTPGSPC